jgi:protein arginine N-methyltransferase 3
VYGFTMAPVSAEIWRGAAGKVALQPVPASALATRPAALHRMDLATMAPRDQDFTAEVVMAAQEPASAEGGGAAVAPAAVSCVVLWFDVEFSARFCAQRPVVLSTSPAAEQTHWVQAVLPLKAPLELPAGGALAARVSMARSPARHRALDVSLEYGVLAAGAGSGAGEGLGAALREAVSFCMEIGGKD